MEKNFISNIKILREEYKVSQLQLAKETGLKKSALGHWELGNRTPNALAVIILSRYFQVSTDYLLKLSEDNSIKHREDNFDVDLTTFNNRLKDLRLKHNKSQNDLAVETNISQPSINFWERGKCLPNANSIITLARYFGVTTDYLLGESD
ncbi:MAG: helix-turn-helix domain-containing protein [Clostridia bacterium]|nr:helix-turn-helix domain-containing protein [Clostridia bacterium]